jgi:Ca-activated chloride channel homolog
VRRRLREHWAALLPLLAALAFPGAARAAVEVAIVSPAAGEPVFGEVEIRARLSGTGPRIVKIEFYVDGLRVGVVEEAPWRVLVDVGQENKEHRFEVVAYNAAGAAASANLYAPAAHTDEVINVRLRQLFVTVEGGPGRALGRSDFTVIDQGERQQLVTFERGDIPFTAVLLLDSSLSMTGGRLDTALSGARSFFNSMNRLDEAKLLLFSDHVLLETPFTSVPAILTIGLADVRPTGGTSLNDALYLALKRLQGRQGRKVVVLLSDGVDVESVLSMDRVRSIAQKSATAIYWLRLRRSEERRMEEDQGQVRRFSVWRDAEDHERQLKQLRETVLESGGTIDEIDRIEQVGGALGRLLRELREQYVLGYYPSKTAGFGSFHEVDVRVPSGFKVRVHRGYSEE